VRPTRKLQATRPDLTTVKTHSLAPLHVGERSGDEGAPVVAPVSWGWCPESSPVHLLGE
jgi:hypothetical protein